MSEQHWVAVVDDDECLRASLVRLLLSVDIPARGFRTGEEFLYRAPGSEPACLVLDINLGAGLNGFEIQERLKSDGSALPIIFITGQPDLALSRTREQRTPPDHLHKPFDCSELLARVRSHLLNALATTSCVAALPETL
jgi:FixJ family two-component response regulator